MVRGTKLVPVTKEMAKAVFRKWAKAKGKTVNEMRTFVTRISDEVIAEIKQAATPHLSIHCKTHPKFKAIGPPSDCPACTWLVYKIHHKKEPNMFGADFLKSVCEGLEIVLD